MSANDNEAPTRRWGLVDRNQMTGFVNQYHSTQPSRWSRPLATSVIVVAAAWLAASVVGYVLVNSIAYGYDYWFYRGVGERWLADGTYFLPHQLAGPYEFTIMVDNLYPPPALALFVPLAFLPPLAWWAVPAAVLAYAVWRWRPSRWAIAAALALMCWQKATWAWVGGNTDLWVMTAVTGGLLWGWPAALVILKPTLAPLALVGVRHRSWWAMAALGVVTIALMWPLWLDYVEAMRNLRGLGLGYSLVSLPLMAVPLVLWFGRDG